MLGDKNIIAFLVVTSASGAKSFYGDVLGLKIWSEDQYAIVFDANGIRLRINIMPHFKPAQYSVLSWVVSDIKKSIAELSAKGIIFEKYEWFKQDELNVWTAPDETKVAWFKDPDGNILALTEFK